MKPTNHTTTTTMPSTNDSTAATTKAPRNGGCAPRKALVKRDEQKAQRAIAKRFKGFAKDIVLIRQKFAPRIAEAARQMAAAASTALALEQEMLAECEAFAGEGVEGTLPITFEPFGGGIEAQLEAEIDVEHAGFEDVVALAGSVETATTAIMVWADEDVVVASADAASSGDVAAEAPLV